MLDDTQQQSLVTRLNRIEGQIRGIRRMVQEPRVCVDILQQLAAAEAALNRISLAIMRFHVEKCVPDVVSRHLDAVGLRVTGVGGPYWLEAPVLSKLQLPGAEGYFVAAWVCLGLGLVGHWIAAYNYFWAIIRKGRGQRPAAESSTAVNPQERSNDDGGPR